MLVTTEVTSTCQITEEPCEVSCNHSTAAAIDITSDRMGSLHSDSGLSSMSLTVLARCPLQQAITLFTGFFVVSVSI